MKTKIYSIFPACGKTWLYEHQEDYNLRILDSDSSYFAWVWECPEDDERGMYSPNARKTNQRNPSFPQNYIDHIKCKIESGKYDCIFVSSHSSVRKALDKEGIDFTIVYPESNCKAEWVGRCFIREKNGESGCSAEAMYNNWELWISECFGTGITHDEIVLKPRKYLSDYFRNSKSDKQKLLEWIENYCNDYMSFEDIIDSYIGSYAHEKEFSAYRINQLTSMLNERLVNALDKMEVAVRIAHERATYLTDYLEGKMYISEEVARQNVDKQIENAKAILETTKKVTLR